MEEATSLSAALKHLRSGDTSISTFSHKPYPHQFSTTTKVDIFEIRDGKAGLHHDLDETALRRYLNVGALETCFDGPSC